MIGISRQGYYKSKKKKGIKKQKEDMVLQLVQSHRRKMPRLGGKKLYRLVLPDLKRMKIKLGRDIFFKLLGSNGLLIHRKKRYSKTTYSSHRFRIYENLIKELEPDHRNTVWVSDITYIVVDDGFCYLALITDKYSRMIVGYDISESLNLEGSIRALRMALRMGKKDKRDLSGLIHHSDRGIQYCSNLYTGLLTENKIKISMSEKGNPYENAIAERVNGILKEEFLLGEGFKTKEQAYRAVEEAIKTYNEDRPHMSINYLTPVQKYAA